jgi:hypothetical protein
MAANFGAGFLPILGEQSIADSSFFSKLQPSTQMPFVGRGSTVSCVSAAFAWRSSFSSSQVLDYFGNVLRILQLMPHCAIRSRPHPSADGIESSID